MTAREERAILRIIDVLYSCVDGESSWSAFLDILANHFAASLCGIATNSSLQAVVGVDSAELLKYQKYYMKINPWLSSTRSYPQGKMLLTEEVLPLGAYRETQFYNEWGKKNLVTHAIGGAIRVNTKSFLFLSINRGDAGGPYEEQDRQTAQVLMPHIQRAANLHERLSDLYARSSVLDGLAFPTMFVASDGALRWANGAAEHLLRRGRGLVCRNGKVNTELPEENSTLYSKLRENRRLSADQVDGYGGWMRITRGDDGSQLSLLLARLPDRLRWHMGVSETCSGFLVIIAEPTFDANALLSRLRHNWALTPAEAALAIEMLESDGLPSAAAKLRISRNTAKTQLAAVFQKAGVRRQSELIRKLLALAVVGPAR